MLAPDGEAAPIEVESLLDMRRLLRELVEASPLSHDRLEELCGIPRGYLSKTLSATPIRGLSSNVIFLIVSALGFKVALRRDAAAAERVRRHVLYEVCNTRQRRLGLKNWQTARLLGFVAERCRAGGRKRMASMTAEELRAHQSRAAKARWRAHRGRLRAARRNSRAAVEAAPPA